MLDASQAYRSAIIGDSRRMYIKAKIYVADPDIVYGSIGGSTQLTDVSKPAQLHDGVLESGAPYITLEKHRWILDGSFVPFEDLPAGDQTGFVTSALSGNDASCNFTVQFNFTGVGILKACAIAFPDNAFDGYPVNLSVQIKRSSTVLHTRSITANTERVIEITGFSAENPTQILLTVTKWSLPRRRIRVNEIIAGVYQVWDDSVIAEFSVVHQGNPASVSLPYGTATITFDNTDHMFDPYDKSSLFEMLEDRQGIELSLGVGLPDTTVEYKKLGMYYQHANGWKMRNNLTITWQLVDIIGLLADRPYIVPTTIPTTLGEWIYDIVMQLGPTFSGRYELASGVASIQVTTTADKLQNQKCGQILLWLCQATCMWARANPANGKLSIGPLADPAGNSIDFDNMLGYPAVSANDDIAKIEFTLANGTRYSVAGNVDAATVLSIQNPFISSTGQADATAAFILRSYGGNLIETTGRGDPTSELGDIVTVETQAGDAQGRIVYADYKFQGGVLTSCVSKMVEVTQQ